MSQGYFDRIAGLPEDEQLVEATLKHMTELSAVVRPGFRLEYLLNDDEMVPLEKDDISMQAVMRLLDKLDKATLAKIEKNSQKIAAHRKAKVHLENGNALLVELDNE